MFCLVCSDFRYLPNDIGISLTITYNKRTIYNETLSGNHFLIILIVYYVDDVDFLILLKIIFFINKQFFI